MDEQLAAYKNGLPEATRNEPMFIQRVVDCIHRHLFDQRLSVQWIKEHCWLDDINISLGFKFYVGKAPQPYWIGHRMKAATILLKDKTLVEASIGDIAYNLGYSTHSAFTIAFEKHTGSSPTAFRERHIRLNSDQLTVNS